MLGINGTKFLTHSQSKVCPPDAYGKKGREVVVEKFSENVYVDNFLALYKSLAGDGAIRGN